MNMYITMYINIHINMCTLMDRERESILPGFMEQLPGRVPS